MIRSRLFLLVVGLGFILAPQAARAHHSEAAEYDATKPVKVTGTLTKVEWLNPHVWFYLDVKDDAGKVTEWAFSTVPPGVLMRRGINKDALKIGSVITVEGVRARDASNNAAAHSVTFSDGRNVFAGPGEGGQR